jgi:hypothetical protein
MSILPAPVTEVAFIKLKKGKESERGDLERYIDELQREISNAKGVHATSWGQSVDPGKENVYVFVLGWDTVAVECLVLGSSRIHFITLHLQDHWAAVGPDTTCGKIIENKLRPIADIELTHAKFSK